MRLEDLTTTDYLALFEQALSSVEEVCSQLGAGDWDAPTDCPGWTVKDHLAHLASYEAVAAGRAQVAEADISHLTHFKQGDAFAIANEREIEARRGLPAHAVLEEFREATTAHLKHLASLDDAGWASDTSSFPWGQRPTKDSLPIRVLDVFYHEQDIRRAAGRSGHLDGAVARFAFERLATALPRIVAKGAGAPDGSLVVWDVGAPGRTVAVETDQGRGDIVDARGDPTVRFACDLETFLCLIGGRVLPARAIADGRLTVGGDRDLADRVLENIVVIP